MKTETVVENGFKKTGIRLIPEDWKTVKLGDVAEISSGGSAPQGDNYFNGKNPFIRVQHIDREGDKVIKWDLITDDAVKKYKLKIYPKGTIVFPKSGASIYLEKRAMLPIDTYIVSHLCAVISNDKNVNQKFLFYELRNIELSKDKADGYPTLNLSEVKNVKVIIPSLSEQQKIAFVLSKIQQAIEQQDRIIETTRELKKSLMNKLFTEGLHGEEQKETEIGLMPKSWGVTSIGEIAPFQGGFAFKSQEYHKAGVRLFKIANVSFGKVIWEDISFLPEEYLTEYDEYILSEGDIVMAMTRPIVSGGIKVTKLSKVDCPCLLNQRVGRFQPATMINPDFLYQFLFTENFVNHILYGAGGSQQPNISANKIEECLILLPTLPEQKEIANILLNVDKKLSQAESKKQTFQALFRTMLNQLMTGKIRVRDLDVEVN